MSKTILHLAEKRARKEKFSGGKGSKLAFLYHYGFNVPEAFILSSQVSKKIFQATARAESGISCKLPKWLERDLQNILQKIAGPVAVRSSMVGEDGTVASHAGQLDTFLNILNVEQLREAVIKCYAGVLNPRFSQYQKQLLKTPYSENRQIVRMAVIIQKMVTTQSAGVAFSANPISGDSCMIIEATRGLGDKLVAGRVDPDRYLLNSQLELVEQKLMDYPNPVLNTSQILELGRLVNAIKSKLGKQQDIEWAWDGSAFQILQSRPITTIKIKPVYSNRLVSDMIPGLIKPLVWSTNLQDMTTNVFGRIFRQIYGENQIDFQLLIKRIHSRVYTNITFLADVFEKIGLPINFFDSILRNEPAINRYPRFSPRIIKTSFRMFIFLIRHSMIKNKLQDFIRVHENRLKGFRREKWVNYRSKYLLQQILRLRKFHRQTQWYMWIGAMNMSIRNRLLNKFVKRTAPEVNPSDLISGLIGLKSLEPNKDLRELGLLANKLDPEIRKNWFISLPVNLKATVNGEAFLCKFDEFMEKYGFLSVNGTDFSVSPWIENPAMILRAIERHLGPVMKSGKNRKRLGRETAKQETLNRLNLWKKMFFKVLLRSTIDYLQLREKLSLFMSEDAYQMRRIYLMLGDKLTEDNHLANPADIFYLNFAEVEQIIYKTAEPSNIKLWIEKRKQQIAADSIIRPPEMICEETGSLFHEEKSEWLQGISGSAGIASGYARVVQDPANLEIELGKQDILIVPFTDVGWTPLFPAIGGIVTETGGQLSHSAIIAREYGLPAVLSVRDATVIIKDGQALTIDGDKGRVYLEHFSKIGG